jgi:hypothetical protein
MDASRSPTTTSDKGKRKCPLRGTPQKPRGAHAQLARLLSPYVRHDSKTHRRKQFRRLVEAATAAMARYRLNDIRQLGTRHVRWWDEQIRNHGRTLKTREAYWYAWCILWEASERPTNPLDPVETGVISIAH